MSGGKHITEKLFRTIIDLVELGGKNSDIAKAVGVNPNTVGRIKKAKTWPNWIKQAENKAAISSPKVKDALFGLLKRVKRIEDHLRLGDGGIQLDLVPPPTPPRKPVK